MQRLDPYSAEGVSKQFRERGEVENMERQIEREGRQRRRER